MKIQVRSGVFETNSSSVHTVTLCTENQFNRWKNREDLYCPETKEFLPLEEAINKNISLMEKYDVNSEDIAEYKENQNMFGIVSDYLLCEFYLSLTEYIDSDYLEYWEEKATVAGTEIVGFGKVGVDG